MTSPRRIPHPTHGVLEFGAGLALLIAALALDLGGTGLVVTFAAGVALAGLGLAAIETLPLHVHETLDGVLVAGLAAGAVVAAAAGSATAAVVLLAVAAAELVLSAGTRWVRR